MRRRKLEEHRVLAYWTGICFGTGAMASLFSGVLGRILFGG